MFEDINFHRAAVADHIAKSFINDFGSEDTFEKGKWSVGDTKVYQGVTWEVGGFNAKGSPLWRKKKDQSGSSSGATSAAPKQTLPKIPTNSTSTQGQSKSSGEYVPKGGSFSDMSLAEARKNLVGRTIKIGDKTAKIIDAHDSNGVFIEAAADNDYLGKRIYLTLNDLDNKKTEYSHRYFGPNGQSIEVSDEEPKKNEVTKKSFEEFKSYISKNRKNKKDFDFINKEYMFMMTVPPKYRSRKSDIHNAVAETIKKLSEVNNW